MKFIKRIMFHPLDVNETWLQSSGAYTLLDGLPTRPFSYTLTHIILKVHEIRKDWLECDTKIKTLSLHKHTNLV